MNKLACLFTVLFAAAVLIAGCVQQTSQPSASPSPTVSVAAATPSSTPSVTATPVPSVAAARFLKGVSLSPKSFQQADFTEFFQRAKEAGQVVMWAGDWNELAGEGAPKVVAELSSTYSYAPLVEAQFFTQSTGALLRPLDDATKENYLNSAVAFAGKYAPAYLAFGIEVNVLYEKSPADFDAFVSFFSEVYDAVKAVSPNTKVFTVFQLEKMKGLNGGLFGGVNNASAAEWQLLQRFPKSDLIVFTTYPDLIYKAPSEIPTDYYSEISSRVSKPVAFTEVGWHSAASPVGWESSEAEQAEFVTRFFELANGLDKELVVWSFVYDPATVEPFNSMGLRKSDGTPRPAWAAWVAG
ncbi:hypothetical protein H0O03_04175 [Candidatus Micrarchaeota archaeon]|nr:hypothetical protein [Candidatus Micrarchaeota archaeon]